MGAKYPRIYAMLIRQGHTAFKALEILIDAKRGQWWAIGWIRLLKQMEA
jgi:hypothetical protein